MLTGGDMGMTVFASQFLFGWRKNSWWCDSCWGQLYRPLGLCSTTVLLYDAVCYTLLSYYIVLGHIAFSIIFRWIVQPYSVP